MRELATFEKKYGEMFLYKGEHYLEVLTMDAESGLVSDTPVVRGPTSSRRPHRA